MSATSDQDIADDGPYASVAMRLARIQAATVSDYDPGELRDLHGSTPWVWLWCERCQHHSPLACAVAVIRWGAGASSDVLRERARCTACGR